MYIKYFGHSCFYIKGKDFSIVLDPYQDIGLPTLNLKADYLYSSHNHYDHNAIQFVSHKKLIRNNFDNFYIYKSFHDNHMGKLRGENNILKFKCDDLWCLFLGDFGESRNNELINIFRNIDILFIPIGGKYTINAKEAKEYIEKIHPKIAIPMHYRIEGCNIEIDNLEEFTKFYKNVKYYDNEIEIVKNKEIKNEIYILNFKR